MRSYSILAHPTLNNAIYVQPYIDNVMPYIRIPSLFIYWWDANNLVSAYLIIESVDRGTEKVREKVGPRTTLEKDGPRTTLEKDGM